MSDWSAKLSKPLYPRDAAPLYTLADARAYIGELSTDASARRRWRHTLDLLVIAACNGPTAIAAATEALKLAVLCMDRPDLIPLSPLTRSERLLKRRRAA